ncbi:molybdenum cofactor biosynthesis prote [Aureobasidium subglaciale]|nr:molybdenum cofactor biosynthesis prote [Aureobasidium subglaciale]
MALAAVRSSRNLSPLIRRLQTERRNIATATAPVQSSLDRDGSILPPQDNRRQAIKQAKPFSDFLTDKFKRQHDYLRISVTERCNLRCLYCMPEEGVPLSPSRHLLTTPEIVYLSELFVSQGVTKIRLTGGEPTVRPDILPLMQQIGSLKTKGLRELALTTNAISLHRKLDKMVEAGLTGVNISLDTLDPFQFQILTRRKGHGAVMKSIDRVLEMNKLGAGIKLKVNCVVMRGINERELVPFVEMGKEKDIEVRFIEYMPFGGNKWSERKMLTYQEMLDIIREKYPTLRSVKGHLNDTSKTYEIPGFVGKIGFITSMTENFCGTCNRLRITGDGNLKVCLHGNTEVSLRDLLRKDNNNDPMDEQAFEAVKEIEMNRHRGLPVAGSRPSWVERENELLNFIGEAVKRKKEKHAGMEELQNMENRPMILIGGAIVYTNASLNYQTDLHDTGADTDLVVAEGNDPRRAPGGVRVLPKFFSGRLGQGVPLHLLHPNMPNSVGIRLYSTASAPSPEIPDNKTVEASQSTESDVQEVQAEETRAENNPTNLAGPESGFASLRGLFGTPRKTWSPPRSASLDVDDGALNTDATLKTEPGQLKQAAHSAGNPVDDDPFEDHLEGLLPRKDQGQSNASGMSPSDSTATGTAHEARPKLHPAERSTGRSEADRAKPDELDAHPQYIHFVAARPPKDRASGSRDMLQFKRASRPAPKNIDATKAANPSKPPPAWKVESIDVKSHTEQNKRKPDDMSPSASTDPRQTVQPNTSSSAKKNREPGSSKAGAQQISASLSTSVKHSTPESGRVKLDVMHADASVKSLDVSSEKASTLSSSRPGDRSAILTHLTSTGEAHMVDVGQKESTDRVAIAIGFVRFSNEETYKLITDNLNKKGDVLGVARIAGIMAAKRCSDLIPLCHPIPITKITLDLRTIAPGKRTRLPRSPSQHGLVAVEARVHTHGKTGVEMEALTAVTGACLTVYDMCKAADKYMSINSACVVYKAGGKSGEFIHGSFSEKPDSESFIAEV